MTGQLTSTCAVSAGTAVSIFVLALGACAAVLALLLRKNVAWRLATDVPNSRSLHTQPTPRVGGWGVVPAAIVVAFVFGERSWLLVGLAFLLFAVSYADDRLDLPIFVRLPVHAAAAAAWLAYGPVELTLIVSVLAGLGMVWITNLFNFMDGADGLAGGMAVFAFGVYAMVASHAGLESLAVWSAAIAGGAAGFLVFNFNPARVFLGDAGSITLGFAAGAFGVWGWSAGAWPVWFPFLLAGPFFTDATVTIVRRILAREAFWRPHRDHYYQRLIRSGWSHRRTAYCEYAAMAASAVLAVAMLGWTPAGQYAGLAAAAAAYGALAYAVDRRWSSFASPDSGRAAAPDGGADPRA
jgi:UDP-N-acetylmuramyl pentapeptide phosphotransferase/UDP-N-acetylglucosamine-1-phosphate transferase